MVVVEFNPSFSYSINISLASKMTQRARGITTRPDDLGLLSGIHVVKEVI